MREMRDRKRVIQGFKHHKDLNLETAERLYQLQRIFQKASLKAHHLMTSYG